MIYIIQLNHANIHLKCSKHCAAHQTRRILQLLHTSIYYSTQEQYIAACNCSLLLLLVISGAIYLLQNMMVWHCKRMWFFSQNNRSRPITWHVCKINFVVSSIPVYNTCMCRICLQSTTHVYIYITYMYILCT